MTKSHINVSTRLKLQSTASGAAKTLRRICDLLADEIGNAPKQGPEIKLPFNRRSQEFIVLRAVRLDDIVQKLSDCAIELDYFSVPVSERAKLPKPNSLK